LAAGLFALSGPLGWLGPAPSAQAKDFVVAAWGDPYEAGWRKSLVPKFEKKHGVTVVWDQGFSSQTLAKLRAQKANPQYDLAMMDDGPYYQGVALGLFEKLDMSKIPNAKNLVPSALEAGDTGVFFAYTGTGMYYNTKIFKEKGWDPPTSYLDLFEPTFAKRVTTHTIANTNGLNILLAMNELAGGKTPENMDPGFAKMKELATQVVTFDQFGETPTLIQQEAVVMGTWNIDRVVNLKNTGVPIEFVFPKEGIWGWRETIVVVKGRPKENQDLAHDFINMMLSQEEQENNAKFIGFIPVHNEVGHGREHIPNMKFPNWDKLQAHRPGWTERWNKEVERRR
jgi:putative spermidine/putrescine transport system substrate-binding protein